MHVGQGNTKRAASQSSLHLCPGHHRPQVQRLAGDHFSCIYNMRDLRHVWNECIPGFRDTCHGRSRSPAGNPAKHLGVAAHSRCPFHGVREPSETCKTRICPQSGDCTGGSQHIRHLLRGPVILGVGNVQLPWQRQPSHHCFRRQVSRR